jgi:hypothetical protein
VPVHRWFLARVPQRSPTGSLRRATNARGLFGIDGGGECGARALDREGPCAQILLRRRGALLRTAGHHKVLLGENRAASALRAFPTSALSVDQNSALAGRIAHIS